jgi:hypothetical protein
MGPALGAVPPNVPALKITPEMMQAVGGFTPPVLPPLPALTPPAPQPHGPPEWFRWWYVLAAAGASAVAGLLYGLLRREPAGG